MKQLTRSSPLRLLAGAALLLSVGLAQAQYAWIDAKGVRQFSDRPPPPDTPRSKILKEPKAQSLAIDAPEAEPAAAKQPEQKKGPPTLAEREQDYRKRKQAQSEAERKTADEAQRKQAQAENCQAAREYKSQLESGVRIAVTNANGERAFLSEEERAQRAAKVERALNACR